MPCVSKRRVASLCAKVPGACGGWRATHPGRAMTCVDRRVLRIGVLFGCFGRKIDGDSWFTWWFNHLPGKPIYFPIPKLFYL